MDFSVDLLIVISVGPLGCLFLTIHIALNIYDACAIVLLLLLACDKYLVILLGANLIKWFDSLSGSFNDRIRNGFLHEVDLALSYQFHMSVRQWDRQLLCIGLPQATQSLCLVGAWCARAWLHWRENEKRVAFCAEIKVFAEWAHDQELCIWLHLQQVVLLLPHKRNALELP